MECRLTKFEGTFLSKVGHSNCKPEKYQNFHECIPSDMVFAFHLIPPDAVKLAKKILRIFVHWWLTLLAHYPRNPIRKELSCLVKASLYKFFLSKNASETFCQGFCPFVKGSNSSIAIVGQKGIHCQVQGGPSILGLLGDLVHLHTSCLCLHADRRVVVEDHLHIPPLADGHLPTFSCPHGHYGAVVHQPLLLQPLALVLHPLPLKVPSEADLK